MNERIPSNQHDRFRITLPLVNMMRYARISNREHRLWVRNVLLLADERFDKPCNAEEKRKLDEAVRQGDDDTAYRLLPPIARDAYSLIVDSLSQSTEKTHDKGFETTLRSVFFKIKFFNRTKERRKW